MRALSRVAAIALACAAPATPLLASGPGQTSTIVATVTFAQRTSLRVSSQNLEFHIPPDAAEATVVVDFTAAARVVPHTDVVLTVEPLRSVEGPGGAADVDTAIVFTGEGEGTRAGVLAPGTPSVAGQWSGGGQRRGRVMFTLRAPAPGTYVLPVRFLLTMP